MIFCECVCVYFFVCAVWNFSQWLESVKIEKDDDYMGYLPVDKFMVVCRCLCPSTRNCGSSTSFEMPTDCRPEFHLYRISRIVYPTAEKKQEHKNLGSNIQYTLILKHSMGYKFVTNAKFSSAQWCEHGENNL